MELFTFGHLLTNATQMKKIFAILTLAGIMIACNDNADNDESTVDSTRLPSTLSPADTSTMPVDTSRRVADTVIKK
jgi:hypothetical protein